MFFLRFVVLSWLLVALAALSFCGQEATSYLGVGVVAIDEQIAHELNWDGSGGLLVTVVQTASPAAKAGLQPDDVIVAMNGKRLRDPAELGSMVTALAPGRKVRLQVFRAGQTSHVSAVLAAREPRPAPEPLVRFDLPAPDTFFTDMPSPALRWRNSIMGVEYEGVDSQLAQFFGVKQGVLIRLVQPGSAASEGGLHAGDVVIKLNGKTVASPRDFALALQNRGRGAQSVPIDVVRNHKQHEMKLKLPGVDSSIAPWTHPVATPVPQ